MANRYWVGGSGTWDTTSTTNWSASSGGSSGASVPTASDSVFFDQAGTYTVTMTGALNCLDITTSTGTVTFVDGTTPTLTINGSMSLVAGTVWSLTGTTTFTVATGVNNTITTNGVAIGTIAFSSTSSSLGGWVLGSALTATKITLNSSYYSGNSTFNGGGYNVTIGSFQDSASLATSKLTLGSGLWTVTGGWSGNSTSFLGTTTIKFTSASAKQLSSTGGTYTSVTIDNAGAGTLTIYGVGTANLYFGDLTASYTNTGATTITFRQSGAPIYNFANFTASGTAGKLLTLNNDSGVGLTRSFNVTINCTGARTCDYLEVANIDFTPGPSSDGTVPYTWYLGANSVRTTAGANYSNNVTGALFLSGSGSPVKVYQIDNTATTSWTVPADWTSSNNKIYIYGGGGGGAGSRYTSSTNKAGGAGGGGGGCTVINNFAASPSSSIVVAVGTAGTGGTAGGGSGGTGGTTSWDSGAYNATGGTGGSTTATPSSVAGTGGTGTYSGGSGGLGATTTGSTTRVGGGGGGGSAGPIGNGAAGSNGNASASLYGAGAGGGNSGGSVGTNSTGAGGRGGYNALGYGGGNGGSGSNAFAGSMGGGGGGGGQTSGSGGVSYPGIEILNSIGGSGGQGGGSSVTSAISNFYAGGGGGGSNPAGNTPTAGTAGGKGLIIITYNLPAATSTGNFLAFF